MPSRQGLTALVVSVFVLCCSCVHGAAVLDGVTQVATCRLPASSMSDYGVGIVSDGSCNADKSIRPSSCLDTQCRMCQVFRSDLSKDYLPCSTPLLLALPVAVMGGIGTVPSDTTPAPATSALATPAPTTLAPTPATTTAAPTPEPTPAPTPAVTTTTPTATSNPAESIPTPTPELTQAATTPAPTTTAPISEPTTVAPTIAVTTLAPTPADTTSALAPAPTTLTSAPDDTSETPAPAENTAAPTPAATTSADLNPSSCNDGLMLEALAMGICATPDETCATETDPDACLNDHCRLCCATGSDFSEYYPNCSTFERYRIASSRATLPVRLLHSRRNGRITTKLSRQSPANVLC